MRILGIDPGYAIVGFGAVEYERNQFTTLQYGAITTRSHTVFEDRLEEIYTDMSQLLDMVKPEAIAIETLFYTTNQKTVIAVAEARGVILLAIQKAGVPVQVYYNNSKIPGGGTLGNLSGSHVALPTVDIGLPQLSMHSPFETAGAKDLEYMVQAMTAFYNTVLTVTGRDQVEIC